MILKSLLSYTALAAALLLAGASCTTREGGKNKLFREKHLLGAINMEDNLPFDSNQLSLFYNSFPDLSRYREDVTEVYRQHHFNHIWYDTTGIVEFGQTLYTKEKELEAEGVSAKFPYQDKIDGVFENDRENTLSKTETELMLTNLYLFYADNVFKGLDDTTTTALGWLLPRKQVEYGRMLDSLITDPQSINRNDSMLFGQYYKLRDILSKYREIEKNGGWNQITIDPKKKFYKPGDTGIVIAQIRERLFITGDLKENSKSTQYDQELVESVKHYQLRNGNNPTEKIQPEHIREMNVPIGERIKKIIVNMERCRWISPAFARSREYIVVNIPAFRLHFVRQGKVELISPVVVGKNVTKTVIFSGMLSYVVFAPYWNLPQSIINKEVKPKMAKDPNYLEKHNMEMVGGQIRQKPGKNNSLGKVKFIFPNSNDIYMHDTPAKSLFAEENRAFSHGCIRVGKPRDLAIAVLEDDPSWTPQRIDAAMNSGKETTVQLKEKIPVYIGYLTAWVDDKGAINFYKDIYNRDEKLAELLISNK
jgi:murein L,D-transpeptidase YcbB/YkuD